MIEYSGLENAFFWVEKLWVAYWKESDNSDVEVVFSLFWDRSSSVAQAGPLLNLFLVSSGFLPSFGVKLKDLSKRSSRI